MNAVTKVIEFSRRIVESKYSIAVVFIPVLHVFYIILYFLTWCKYASNRLFFRVIPVFLISTIIMRFVPNIPAYSIVYGAVSVVSWISMRAIQKQGLLYKNILTKQILKRGIILLTVLALIMALMGTSRFFQKQANLSGHVEEIITANIEDGVNSYDAFTNITLEGEIESIQKTGGGMGYTNKTGLYVYSNFCVTISGKEYDVYINSSLTNQVWSVNSFSIEESGK